MIRKSTLTLEFGNTGKLLKLRGFLKEYSICINKFIDLLCSINRFRGSFVERGLLDKIDSPLTFTAKQSASVTALQIIKSQRKKKIKTKPKLEKQSYNFDQRFIQIKEGDNSFDLWIKFKCMGFDKPIKVPTNKH